MKHEILDTLRLDGPLSITELAHKIWLSATTTALILDEMQEDGSIIKSRGKYKLSKTQIIMDVLHESGPCSYELLAFELKGDRKRKIKAKMSSQDIYAMDTIIQDLIDDGRVRINKDGAHCVVK